MQFPHKCEVSLSHLPPSASLKGFYLLLPDLFHPCKAHDIKTLKGVGKVGWITENDNVVLGCVAEELWVVVGTVAVKQQHSGTSPRLLSCLLVEIFDDVQMCQLRINPSVG
jgi:hypothetical protein